MSQNSGSPDCSFDPRPAVRALVVPPAGLHVARDENILFCSHPLGAGVGVVIHDPEKNVAGFLHSLLPDSSLDPFRAVANPGMFVDTGLHLLLDRVYELRARKENLLIYLAGGAAILGGGDWCNLGKENCDAVRDFFTSQGLKIHVEEIGGTVNRTLQFHGPKGEARVSVSGQPKEILLCRRSTNT